MIVGLILAFCFAASAQEPIGPLRRLGEPPGQYTWRVSLGYTPAGREGLGVDEFGIPYSYTLFVQEWRLGFSGTVQLATGLKMGAEIAEISTIAKELRRYPSGEERLERWNSAIAYSFFCETCVDPKSPWDPRTTVSLGHPWVGGITLSLSLLRDPMVIIVDFSFLGRKEEPQGWFAARLGAGFVANPWISISAAASLTVPVIGIGVPEVSVGLRVRYALDVKGEKEIGVRTTLILRGDQPLVSLEGEWLGRGP